MTERVFVDTNVLVYVYDLDQPAKKEIATRWIERAWLEQSGRTSIQVLNELYVTLTRKLARRMNPNEAWDIVHALLAWSPQPSDRDLLSRAREVERRYRVSWWDSLIVAAAQLQDCDTLLTEDLQPGMVFDRVVVRNPFSQHPFNAGVHEPRAGYATEQVLPPRHRRPGRPRKQSRIEPG